MNSCPPNESCKISISSAPIQPTIGEIAEKTLIDRFTEIRRQAGELLTQTSSKSDAVHLLRVACRRAEATLDFFRAVLEPEYRRRMIKQLRKLRSRLGSLRDLDVMADQFGRKSSEGTTILVGMIRRDYEELMVALVPRIRAFLSKATQFDPPTPRPLFGATAKKLTNKPFKAWGYRRAEKIAKRFLASLMQSDRNVKALHQLRIRAKKLRYSLELLAPVVTAVVDSRAYRRLHTFQTLLGDIRDGIIQCKRLKNFAATTDRRSARCVAKSHAKERRAKHAQLVRRLERLRSKRQLHAFEKELTSLLAPSDAPK
jgi:CHAD domain-containing protein